MRLSVDPILVAAIVAVCLLSTRTEAFAPCGVPSLTFSATVAAPRKVTPVPLSSSPDENALTNDGEATAAQDLPKAQVKCPNCDKCDGTGRILGGIAVLFPWWPIKAYRPCPNFIAKGGFYERSGQGLDEIAFGRDSTFEK